MKIFWLFQRNSDGLWDAVEEREWEKVHEVKVRSGSLHLVEAKNLSEAIAMKIPVEEVIQRAQKDEKEKGIAFCYRKWFGSLSEKDYDEDDSENIEAEVGLSNMKDKWSLEEIREKYEKGLSLIAYQERDRQYYTVLKDSNSLYHFHYYLQIEKGSWGVSLEAQGKNAEEIMKAIVNCL